MVAKDWKVIASADSRPAPAGRLEGAPLENGYWEVSYPTLSPVGSMGLLYSVRQRELRPQSRN